MAEKDPVLVEGRNEAPPAGFVEGSFCEILQPGEIVVDPLENTPFVVPTHNDETPQPTNHYNNCEEQINSPPFVSLYKNSPHTFKKGGISTQQQMKNTHYHMHCKQKACRM